VRFALANVDTTIEHDLRPSDPETVMYQVMRADRACRIYDDQSGTRKPWAADYVILRSDVAGASVRLLLTRPPEE
jgi:hypothetical protein